MWFLFAFGAWLESRYTVCRLPRRCVSAPVIARVPNPVIAWLESRYETWLESRYSVCRIPCFYLAARFDRRDKCRICALLVAHPRSTYTRSLTCSMFHASRSPLSWRSFRARLSIRRNSRSSAVWLPLFSRRNSTLTGNGLLCVDQ